MSLREIISKASLRAVIAISALIGWLFGRQGAR
jgi:hypothetical protein